MSFTPEQRAKALATRLANKKKRDEAGAHVRVASTKDVPNEHEKKLLDRIAELEAKLHKSEAKRSEAEQSALDAAQAQGMLLQREIQEVPTGQTVTVKRLDHYKVVGHKDSGEDILRPTFKDVKLPTYMFKIDLPPCGGTDLKINGVPFYHGAVYKLDIDTLRTVKEMVYRMWEHDKQIHGTDENFYRAKHKDIDPRNRISARNM